MRISSNLFGTEDRWELDEESSSSSSSSLLLDKIDFFGETSTNSFSMIFDFNQDKDGRVDSM